MNKEVEQIRVEIERLISEYGAIETRDVTDENFKTARLIGYRDVLHFIDRMQEKKSENDKSDETVVSQSLEEAAKEESERWGGVCGFIYRPWLQACFIKGARWFRKKILSEETVITGDVDFYEHGPIICTHPADVQKLVDKHHLKQDDEVRLVMLTED